MTHDAFIARLAGEISPECISTDPSDLGEYGRDWTRVFSPNPSVVLFPRSTADVSTILGAAHAHGVAIVPSGGRTGLSGGAVAARGEAVLSLQRMRRLDPVDTVGQTVRVQAGAITEAVHRHVAEAGLFWPVDFASKGSSQVGGNIATNAGGVRVIRYGLTRQWVLGLQVVLASGEVLELNGALEKNNSGVDLRQLFIGSEGTLGVVTEATLKLTRLPSATQVMVFAVRDLAAVLALFAEARRGPFVVSAYEFFTDKCLARLMRHRSVRPPVGDQHSHYVLLEVEEVDRDTLEQWCASVLEKELAADGTLAANSSEAAHLWTLREGISESLSATGFPHKNDIALPVARLLPFTLELQRFFADAYPGWEIALFGHIGDGNLHLNVMKPDALGKEEFLEKTSAADEQIFALVRAHGGTISAEHGIGLLKKKYLHYTRTEGELALFRAMKQALDPKGILNPGKIFDLPAV